jgi:hypothetical protein
MIERIFLMVSGTNRCRFCEFYDPNNWCWDCLFSTEVL